MKKISLIFLIVFMAKDIKAQTTISGEVRPRTEYNHGLKTLAKEKQDPSLYTSQRTRLNVRFDNEYVRTKLVLQDVRIWGNQKQAVKNQDKSVSIHEAWADLLFTPELSLRLGRQELSYDDQRIFGALGWLQQARAHDLAMFRYKSDFTLDLGVSYNEDGNIANNFYTTNNYKSMQFAWFNKTTENFSMSLLAINLGYADNETDMEDKLVRQTQVFSQTFGGRFIYTISGLKIEANAYLQTGKREKRTLNAHNWALNLIYPLTESFTANLGTEILSGTDANQVGGDNNSFTPLFGTNHKFNGLMDYFFVGNHINNVGLMDNHLKLTYKVGALTTKFNAHYFTADEKLKGTDEKFLGTEFDLVGSYKMNESVTFTGGYSQLFGSDQMVKLKRGNKDETQNWAWLMITVKPTIFTTKEEERPEPQI